MKKLVLLTLAATVVAGSAFAAAPVTKISDGSTKVQADYAFKQHVSKVYKVHPNVNIYGAGTAIRTHDTELGFQAGVIGHVPLTEKVNGFAKAGWGNDIKQTYQVGAQYEVRPDIDLNLYYGYDKYSVDSNDKTAKGLHAGVGYSF